MLLQSIDAAAKRAGRSHGLVQVAMSGALARVLDQPNPTTPYAQSDLRNALSQIAFDGHSMILAPVFEEERTLIEEAYFNAGAPFEPLAASDGDALSENVMLVLGNDMHMVERTWKRFALNVSLATAIGQSQTKAIIQNKYGQLSSIKFTRPDRAGKQWASGVYSQNLVRGYLLSAYVVSYLHGLTLIGRDVAVVDGLEEGHRHQGLRFSITGQTPGLATFETIRDEVFHPNSNALVSQG